MNLIITTKKFRLLGNDQQYIGKLVKKILRFIPWKDDDYPLLEIILRKHKKKSLDHSEKKLIAKDLVRPLAGHETIDNPVYYDGTVDLILPKKRLVANMLGKTVHEAIKDGFDELFSEIDTYKGLHFSGNSKYYSHQTIRQKQFP